MEHVRFKKFTLLIDGIHKSVHSLKMTVAPDLGVKGVHILWVYELLHIPEGLTAAELASRSKVNRSLVSREIEALISGGYISTASEGGSRYNEKYSLTDKGRALAVRIHEEVVAVQKAAGFGISEEELISFYSTLEKLNNNFSNIEKNMKKRRIENEQKS